MLQRLLRPTVPLLAALAVLVNGASAQAVPGPTLGQIDQGKLSLAGTGMTVHFHARLGTVTENQALLVFGDSVRALYVDQKNAAAHLAVAKRYLTGNLLSGEAQTIKANLAAGITFRGADSWFDVSRLAYRKTAHGATLSFTACGDLRKEKLVKHGVASPVQGLYSTLEVHAVEMVLKSGGSWKVSSVGPLNAAGPGQCGRP